MAQEAEFESLVSEWRDLLSLTDLIPGWEVYIESMRSEESALRASGRWRSGGRTLLHALGLHHDEVRLCAGLAWLLRPDGWHGLGTSLLGAVLSEIGLQALDDRELASASVITEETSVDGTTRADIVIRLPESARTILVEAKVWATEQDDQCSRLADLWGDESPTLVFLTRTGASPTTAGDRLEQWIRLTWADVARLMRQVDSPTWQPGVRDLMETIEIYGGARLG